MANLPARTTETIAVPQGVLDLLVEYDMEIPLQVAISITDDNLERASIYVRLSEDQNQALRWAIGAALTDRRRAAAQGEWTAWIGAFSERVGRSSRALGAWMLEAQEHYSLEPPKGANEARRGRARTSPPPVRQTRSAAASSDDVAVDPIDAVARPSEPPATASDDVTEPEAAQPAPAPKPKVKPAESVRKATPRDDFAAGARALLDGNPVELDMWAKAEPTTIGALETLIGRLSLVARGARTRRQAATKVRPAVEPGTIRCGHRFGPPCDDCVKAAG